MKLTVFNGSPRGSKGNTHILAKWFLKSLKENKNNQLEYYYLNKIKSHPDLISKFINSKVILLAFPLYTDAMPGIVKSFIDLLDDYQGKLTGLKIGFMVHSGFPEATHSRHLENYLCLLAKKLNMVYLGTIIKGGSEGIRIMPSWMTRKTRKKLNLLGSYFNQTLKLDPVILKKLASPERMSASARIIFTLLSKTGFTNLYWNNQLKKNHAWDKRFNAPYVN